MPPTPPSSTNATVVSRTDIAPCLFSLVVRPDNPIAFLPGQVVSLGVPGPDGKLIRRVYSIAAAPGARDLEFLVANVANGILAPLLALARAGDRLNVGPKATGAFNLSEAAAGKILVLAATGSGVGATLGLLRQAIGERRWDKIVLLHGARSPALLAHAEHFRSLVRSLRSFSYIPVVSRPYESPEGWLGARGHIQDAWRAGMVTRALGGEPNPADTQVFACGNPTFCTQIGEFLRGRGFVEHSRATPGNLHLEAYW